MKISIFRPRLGGTQLKRKSSDRMIAAGAATGGVVQEVKKIEQEINPSALTRRVRIRSKTVKILIGLNLAIEGKSKTNGSMSCWGERWIIVCRSRSGAAWQQTGEREIARLRGGAELSTTKRTHLNRPIDGQQGHAQSACKSGRSCPEPSDAGKLPPAGI